jgi:hypothetical protein
MGSGTPMPVPVEPTRSRAGLWIVVGLVVVLAVVAVIAIAGGGSSLPDSFGGADRVDSGPMAELVESMSDSFDVGGVEMDFAIYGGELDPRYMVILVEGDAATMGGSLTDQFRQGFAGGMGAQIDMDAAIEDSVDGVDFLCVPAAAEQFAAFGGEVGMCVFQDGDQVGMAMSLQDAQLYGLMEHTQALHDAVTG